MNVLVASASKHGATDELAGAIGAALALQGINADVRQMQDVETVVQYDAFVLGSAIYMGSWLPSARRFLHEHGELLAMRPTWLFSSGPIGAPPDAPAKDSFDGDSLAETIGARDHRVFGGKLDKSKLGLTERVITGALGVPEGDYREWHAVVAWATAIGRALEPKAVV